MERHTYDALPGHDPPPLHGDTTDVGMVRAPSHMAGTTAGRLPFGRTVRLLADARALPALRLAHPLRATLLGRLSMSCGPQYRGSHDRVYAAARPASAGG